MSRSRSGFTLVEILFLAGVTCALSLAYFLFVRSTKNEVEDLRLRTQAMLGAQQVLEEMRHQFPRMTLAGFPPRRMELEGMTGSLTIAPYPPRPSMYLVTVEVRWGVHRMVLTELIRDYRATLPAAANPGASDAAR